MLRIDHLVKSFAGEKARGKKAKAQEGHATVFAVNDVSFEVKEGELFTLLGPSGCGKTTTLRSIAGLEKPDSGTIAVGDRVLFSGGAKGGDRAVNMPANQRGLGMVFQSYAIWPHMTVFDNVAFPLQVRKRADRPSKAEIKERVERVLATMELSPQAGRQATKLSGGQQQRLALARALVIQPPLLLLDEPLSNLDAKLRESLRYELKRLQRELGITSVYVTHDLEEALAMSDRIVVMRDGNIEQIGSPTEIYNLPRNAFVADFIGSSNLITGRLRPDLASDGLIALETSAGQIVYGVAHGRAVPPEPVFSVRTVYLRLSFERPSGLRNVWPVRVHHCVFQGDFSQVNVTWGDRDLVVRSAALEPIPEGRDAFLSVEPRHCVLIEGS
jgi:iron(III) transport system ATP-binding protein